MSWKQEEALLNDWKENELSNKDCFYKMLSIIERVGRKIVRFNFGDSLEKPLLEELNVCGFWESWQIFSAKLIPFELWSDICEEGLALLKKLLEDPSIPYTELPGFKEFEIRKREKLRAIQKMPEYANRFTMDSYN